MILKQISIFLENKQGKLADAARNLAQKRINIRALSLADTERFGILRIIADDTDVALGALHEMGVTAKVSEVVGVEVPDRPGGLSEILTKFENARVNVEYMYAEVQGKGDKALLIMKLEPLDRALKVLAEEAR